MVYKIIGNFDEVDFDKILTKLTTLYDFMYLDNTLFIALRDYKTEEEGQKLLKSALKPTSAFVTKQITEKNLMNLHESTMTWCRDNLLRLDQQRFEDKEQDKLKRVWKAMDQMEIELSEQLNNKERG